MEIFLTLTNFFGDTSRSEKIYLRGGALGAWSAPDLVLMDIMDMMWQARGGATRARWGHLILVEGAYFGQLRTVVG
jgi:hypothetical protein